jgi:hypothetical protein
VTGSEAPAWTSTLSTVWDQSRHVSGTPTFFINGRRHHGPYDLGALSDAVRVARARVTISQDKPARR